MRKTRTILLIVVLVVIIAAVFIVADANRRGQGVTAGIAEITNRQSTTSP